MAQNASQSGEDFASGSTQVLLHFRDVFGRQWGSARRAEGAFGILLPKYKNASKSGEDLVMSCNNTFVSAEFPRVPRVWPGAVFSPGRFGIVHPSLPWHEVMEAYYWDNLKVAMGLAESAGLGVNLAFLSIYRMIEAEHLTREESVLSDRGDWLLLEYIADTTDLSLPQIDGLVRSGCDQVAETYGWSHGPAVLVTLLHPINNAPYVPGRHGFFIDKYPFDKICLPTDLLGDSEKFIGAVRHEYAHAMALNRTQGKCPLWLHEAIAMVAEHGSLNPRRPSVWRDPNSLDSAFRADRESDVGSRVVNDAYNQSFCLGSFLIQIHGNSGLGRLLDAFTDNSFGQELLMRVTNQRPEDEALKQVYGFGLNELFARARG